MKFKLNITSNDAALNDHPACELARILREIADRLEVGDIITGNVFDINGNTVGHYALTGTKRKKTVGKKLHLSPPKKKGGNNNK